MEEVVYASIDTDKQVSHQERPRDIQQHQVVHEGSLRRLCRDPGVSSSTKRSRWTHPRRRALLLLSLKQGLHSLPGLDVLKYFCFAAGGGAMLPGAARSHKPSSLKNVFQAGRAAPPPGPPYPHPNVGILDSSILILVSSRKQCFIQSLNKDTSWILTTVILEHLYQFSYHHTVLSFTKILYVRFITYHFYI